MKYESSVELAILRSDGRRYDRRYRDILRPHRRPAVRSMAARPDNPEDHRIRGLVYHLSDVRLLGRSRADSRNVENDAGGGRHMGVEERLERIERLLLLGSKEVLNTSEIALLLGISESRVRHLTSAKKIPHYKQGANKAFEWNIGDSGAFNIIGARIETNKDRSRIVLNPNSRSIEMYYNDTLIAFWSSDANGSFINIMPREGGAANKYAAISSNAISLNRDFPDGLSYLSGFNSDNANLWVRGQRNARVVNFIVGVKNTNTNGYPILKILMDGIPTSDPKVYGQVWRDGTTLKISQG